jgi:sarcosine oxidase subunit beta
MSTLAKADVAIIGGGIIGTSIALRLAQAGKRVVVLEKSTIAAEASGRCGGGVRQQGRHPAEIPIAILSVEMWQELDEELEVDTEYRMSGNLWLAYCPDELKKLESDALIQIAAGLPIEILEPEAIRRFAPILTGPVFVGGSYCRRDGHANPLLTTRGFAGAAARAGVEIYEHTEVIDISVSGGEVRAVMTKRGEVRSPVVVNAAGPWAPAIGKMTGLELPIDPSLDQIMVTEPLSPICQPFVICDHRFYFRQATSGGIHIGTIVDPARVSWDKRTDPNDLSSLARAIVELAPAMGSVKILRSWAGTSEKTIDDLPIMGAADNPAGMFIAAGFSGHGFALGPAVGRLMSQLIRGLKPAVPLEPFKLQRFENAAVKPMSLSADMEQKIQRNDS